MGREVGTTVAPASGPDVLGNVEQPGHSITAGTAGAWAQQSCRERARPGTELEVKCSSSRSRWSRHKRGLGTAQRTPDAIANVRDAHASPVHSRSAGAAASRQNRRCPRWHSVTQRRCHPWIAEGLHGSSQRDLPDLGAHALHERGVTRHLGSSRGYPRRSRHSVDRSRVVVGPSIRCRRSPVRRVAELAVHRRRQRPDPVGTAYRRRHSTALHSDRRHRACVVEALLVVPLDAAGAVADALGDQDAGTAAVL